MKERRRRERGAETREAEREQQELVPQRETERASISEHGCASNQCQHLGRIRLATARWSAAALRSSLSCCCVPPPMPRPCGGRAGRPKAQPEASRDNLPRRRRVRRRMRWILRPRLRCRLRYVNVEPSQSGHFGPTLRFGLERVGSTRPSFAAAHGNLPD